MNQNPDLKSKIVKVKKSLPKKQQKLCDFILKNAFGDINREQGYALTDVWDKSVDLLNQSLKPDLIENFATAVEYIENATSVCILGTRPYRATALYFEHLLNEFYLNIHQLSN